MIFILLQQQQSGGACLANRGASPWCEQKEGDSVSDQCAHQSEISLNSVAFHCFYRVLQPWPEEEVSERGEGNEKANERMSVPEGAPDESDRVCVLGGKHCTLREGHACMQPVRISIKQVSLENKLVTMKPSFSQLVIKLTTIPVHLCSLSLTSFA